MLVKGVETINKQNKQAATMAQKIHKKTATKGLEKIKAATMA